MHNSILVTCLSGFERQRLKGALLLLLLSQLFPATSQLLLNLLLMGGKSCSDPIIRHFAPGIKSPRPRGSGRVLS